MVRFRMRVPCVIALIALMALLVACGEDELEARAAAGERIAFVSTRGNNFDVYVVDANGDNQTNLTNHPRVDEAPAWSPDGESIAFADGWLYSNIFVMDADGANQRMMTDDGASSGADPAWSPDGTYIVFSSWPAWGRPDLYIMDADGGNRTKITDKHSNFEPAWAP